MDASNSSANSGLHWNDAFARGLRLFILVLVTPETFFTECDDDDDDGASDGDDADAIADDVMPLMRIEYSVPPIETKPDTARPSGSSSSNGVNASSDIVHR